VATILLDSSEKRTLKEQATLTTLFLADAVGALRDVRQNGSAPEAEDAENGGVDADNASADAENIDPDK